jgi:ubiquitin carboxyl-terminal hydrolase 4/11/15
MQQTSLELHPPRLKALVLSKDVTDVTGLPHPYVTVSSKDTVKDLLTALASAAFPWKDPSVSSRVWKVASEDFEGSQYPLSKLDPGGSSELLFDKGQTVEEALIEPFDAFVVEFQEEGKWLVGGPDESHTNGAAIVPPEVPPPLFSAENNFFDRMSHSSSATKYNASAHRTSLAGPSTLKAAAPIKYGSSSTRKFTEEPGTLGLGNM